MKIKTTEQKPEQKPEQKLEHESNDPPEPGTMDVALAPNQPDLVRRGFTTLQMANAFRNSLKVPTDYLVVEIRDGVTMSGSVLCHCVISKEESMSL